MALDVYVMPLWRFKAGDVETAVQRLLGGKSKIVAAPFGVFRPQRIKDLLARRRAKQQVRRIVSEAQRQLNTKIKWHDEGEVVHSIQAPCGFEALRAYCKWLDLQDCLPAFSDPPNDNYYEHPAMQWNAAPRPFRFSHIIDHSCHSGYYVPSLFELVALVEPFQSFGSFTFYHSFGSSYTLTRQLQTLAAHLPSDASSISDQGRRQIAVGFQTLVDLAAKSLEHKLPIIFWG